MKTPLALDLPPNRRKEEPSSTPSYAAACFSTASAASSFLLRKYIPQFTARHARLMKYTAKTHRTRTKFGRDTGNIPQANKRQELPACTSRRTSPVAFERVHRPRQSKTHQHNRFENLCHYLPPFIHGFTQSAFGAIRTMLPCPCQPSSTNRPFGRSTGLAGHLP